MESHKEIIKRINQKKRNYEERQYDETEEKRRLLQKLQDHFKDLDNGIYSLTFNDWKVFREEKYDDSDIIDGYTSFTVFVNEQGVWPFKTKNLKLYIFTGIGRYMFGIDEAHKLKLEDIKKLYDARDKILYRIESKYNLN